MVLSLAPVSSMADVVRSGVALHVEVPAGAGDLLWQDDSVAEWLMTGKPVVLQFATAADALAVRSELTIRGRA